MKKTWKRLCTGFLALATVVTALPTTPVHAESKQYWTESAERVGIIEKVMNDGSIGSTFNEGYMKVEGETAYCIDINTDFKNGYKTRADASSRMSAQQNEQQDHRRDTGWKRYRQKAGDDAAGDADTQQDRDLFEYFHTALLDHIV